MLHPLTRFSGKGLQLGSRAFHSLPKRTEKEKLNFLHHYIDASASFERKDSSDVAVQVRTMKVFIRVAPVVSRRTEFATVVNYDPRKESKATSELDLTLMLGSQEKAIRMLAIAKALRICTLETPEDRWMGMGFGMVPDFDKWIIAKTTTAGDLR